MKKVFIGVVVVLVVIQFIRPERNVSRVAKPDTTFEAMAPDSIRKVLQVACYDCHSNSTNYPWYSEIMPLGWWLDHHVDEGKAEFNFSSIESYNDKKLAHKLEETIEMVEAGEMPLSSYTLLHPEAKLTKEQVKMVVDWAKSEKAKLESGR